MCRHIRTTVTRRETRSYFSSECICVIKLRILTPRFSSKFQITYVEFALLIIILPGKCLIVIFFVTYYVVK